MDGEGGKVGEKPDGRGARAGASRDAQKDRAFIRRVFPPDRQERALREWHYGVTKQIALVLAAFGHRRLDGLPASIRTHAVRAEVLFPAFRELREALGFRLRTIRRFNEHHWQALVWLWVREGIAASTINTRLSVLRVFARWIGKPGLIPEVTELSQFAFAPETARRVSHATANRGWAGKVDVEAKLQEAEDLHVRSGLALRMAHAFALRRKEATRFNPHSGDRGDAILVLGAKGGQQRLCPIRTPEQRALVDRCKELIPPGDSLGGKAKGLLAGYKKLGRVVAAIGMTKAETGTTMHGLRQDYINDRIEEETGAVASVRDPTATLPSDPEAMEKRIDIMKEVGHHDPDSARGYYGKARPATTTKEGKEGGDGAAWGIGG